MIDSQFNFVYFPCRWCSCPANSIATNTTSTANRCTIISNETAIKRNRQSLNASNHAVASASHTRHSIQFGNNTKRSDIKCSGQTAVDHTDGRSAVTTTNALQYACHSNNAKIAGQITWQKSTANGNCATKIGIGTWKSAWCKESERWSWCSKSCTSFDGSWTWPR